MDLTTLLVAAALLAVGLLAGYRLGRHRLGSRSSGDVDAMLTGTHSAVQRLEAQLREIDRERAGSSGALREQLAALHHTSSELSRQTASLAAALRTPQVRGRWGELQLERIVELAGMAEHCDFDTQVTVGDAASGFSRPDLVVRLAGGRVIPVDAKVPFGAWLEAIDRGLSGPDAEHLLTRARQGDARACRRAGRQGILAAVPALARVRGDVRTRRAAAGRCPATRPGTDRLRVPAQRRAGHPHHPDHPAADGRVQLAAGAALRVRGADPCARPRAARADRGARRPPAAPRRQPGEVGGALQRHRRVPRVASAGHRPSVHRPAGRPGAARDRADRTGAPPPAGAGARRSGRRATDPTSRWFARRRASAGRRDAGCGSGHSVLTRHTLGVPFIASRCRATRVTVGR